MGSVSRAGGEGGYASSLAALRTSHHTFNKASPGQQVEGPALGALHAEDEICQLEHLCGKDGVCIIRI